MNNGSGNVMKWIDDLAALPVRYFCNYSLLAVVGLAFEYAVWLVRHGNWMPAYGIQSMIVVAVQVTIVQTAAEFFRAEGPAGFFPRLAAAAAHFALFTLLILLQLDLTIPLGGYFAMFGIIFWLLAIEETRLSSRWWMLLGLPLLIFGIMVARPFLEDAFEARKFPGRPLLIANVILFLILRQTWSARRKKTKTSARAVQ